MVISCKNNIALITICHLNVVKKKNGQICCICIIVGWWLGLQSRKEEKIILR